MPPHTQLQATGPQIQWPGPIASREHQAVLTAATGKPPCQESPQLSRKCLQFLVKTWLKASCSFMTCSPSSGAVPLILIAAVLIFLFVCLLSSMSVQEVFGRHAADVLETFGKICVLVCSLHYWLGKMTHPVNSEHFSLFFYRYHTKSLA